MKDLYKELMALSEDTEGKFFFVDHVSLAGETMRVFSYHIAAYSDWLLPSAIESRGIMFQIDENGEPVRLVSRPMEKFFNVNENPFTMDLDFQKVIGVMDKADGSLISTYITGTDSFGLKSKTSLSSEQAVAASRYIKRPENVNLFTFCQDCAIANLTVNMEWVSPNNRIVLEYTEARLIILNVRNNETGEYLDLYKDLPPAVQNAISPWLCEEYVPDIAKSPTFLEDMRAETGIEGVILLFEDGYKVTHAKLKTQWYVDLHQTKDSISNPKRLVTTILNNNHDDLYALFSEDPNTIERIRKFEKNVVDTIHADVNTIVALYRKNRGLDRKSYAINGQKELPPWLFGVYMNQFNGLQPLYEGVSSVYLRQPQMLIPEEYLNEV